MGLSDKSAKKGTDDLISMNLLEARKEGRIMKFYAKYPISISPWIRPDRCPTAKEANIMVL